MEPRDMFAVENLTNCQSRGKWVPLVLYLLRDGKPQRYAQLKRPIKGVSQKMLTQTLRQLEEQGIVSRTIYPTVPPTVEYALTEQGRRMLEPFRDLMEQAIQNERSETS